MASEKVELARRIEEALGNRQGQRTDLKPKEELVADLPQVKPGAKTRDIAAKAVGMNRETYWNNRNKWLIDKVDTNILNLAKQYQNGRVSENDTKVTFNFTERWYGRNTQKEGERYWWMGKCPLICTQRMVF